MDRVIKKKSSSFWQNKSTLIVGFGLVVASILVYASNQTAVDLAVSKDRVLTAEVKKGPMTIRVSGNGVLVPDQIQWLASRVAGRVETVHVKAGANVTQGMPLITLSNPELNQMADETRWSYEAEVAQLNALKVSLDSEKLNQHAKTMRAKFAYESARLQLEAEEILIKQGDGVISQIDFKKTKLRVQQLKESWEIEEQISKKQLTNFEAQITAKQAQVNRLQNILARAEQQVKDLKIVASMNGIVQESSMEVGQQVSIGHNVAKIADPKSLIAEIQVPELIAANVQINQLAVIDTRNGKVNGVVTRVNPAVVNGNVQVDIAMKGELPTNARPDLSVVGEITISDIESTLYVARPAFSQANRQMVLFKLDQSGYASKVPVKIGQASTNQIQIVSGLERGDQIVISDTSDWSNHSTVLIN